MEAARVNSSRRVIKAEQVQWSAGRLITTGELRRPGAPAAAAADLEGANAKARAIVQAARDQAAETVRAAQEHAAETLRQAQAEGLRAAEAEAAQLLLSAHGVLDEVEAWRQRLLAQSDPIVVELVSAIARKLFGDGFTLDAKLLQQIFDQALAEARPLGALRVHVNPDDAQVLGAQWPPAGSSQNLELLPDPAIRRGGCLIEGDYGAVDARTDSKLALTLDALAQTAADAAEAGEQQA